jgi:hypothetical protein
MFVNYLITGLNLVSPYLISKIIECIEAKNDKQNPSSLRDGLIYVFLLVSQQGITYLISEHLDYYQRIIGVK